MGDEKQRTPIRHPAYQKQRESLLRRFDLLDYEDQELVQTFISRWAFMERSRHRQWELDNGKGEKPRILGA